MDLYAYTLLGYDLLYIILPLLPKHSWGCTRLSPMTKLPKSDWVEIYNIEKVFIFSVRVDIRPRFTTFYLKLEEYLLFNNLFARYSI